LEEYGRKGLSQRGEKIPLPQPAGWLEGLRTPWLLVKNSEAMAGKDPQVLAYKVDDHFI
jgi:hypothetical protein